MIDAKGNNPKVLFCGRDPNGQLCAWIEHDEDGFSVVEVSVVATGQWLDYEPKRHVNTIVDGAYVWHFYQS